MHNPDENEQGQERERVVPAGEKAGIVDRFGFPMPQDLVIDRLERTRWAREFSFQDISGLSEFLRACEIPQGSYIIREGDEERFLCIMLSGEAAVVKQDLQGNKSELAVISKGAAFGEQSLFEGRRRSASVVSKTDCIVLVLTHDHLRFMEVEKPRVTCRVLFKLGTVLSERLRATSANLVDAKTGIAPQAGVY